MQTSIAIIAISIALIQIFDVVIHTATNQIEILRVTSNVVILLWLVMISFKKLHINFLTVSILSISLYLIMNITFLAQSGLTNPEQDDELRLTLFVLVFLTTGFSGLLVYIKGKSE